MQELEMEDGGCLQLDLTGVIRYIDEHGNCENTWGPEDDGYQAKRDLFD
jgi:hypothetical protein